MKANITRTADNREVDLTYVRFKGPRQRPTHPGVGATGVVLHVHPSGILRVKWNGGPLLSLQPRATGYLCHRDLVETIEKPKEASEDANS